MKQILKKQNRESFNPKWDEKNFQEVPFNKEKSFRQKRLWKLSHRTKKKDLNPDGLLCPEELRGDGFNSKKKLSQFLQQSKNRVLNPVRTGANEMSFSAKKPFRKLPDRIKKGRVFLNSRGQGLIEYLILVALMAVATIGIIRTLNQTVKSRFANSIYALQGRNQKAKTHNLRKEEYQRSDLSNFMSGAASTDKKRDSKKR